MKCIIFCHRLLVIFLLIIVSHLHAEAQQLKPIVLSGLKATEIREGITLQTESGAKGTFGIFKMKKGAFVPMHSHENEQFSFILKGRVSATIGDTVFVLKKGQAVIIPAHVPHSFKSLSNHTIDLDFFSHRREDWINGSADYFRK